MHYKLFYDCLLGIEKITEMKIYNVNVTAIYNASYEGEIDKSYTRLVFANTEEEAIEFVNKDLSQWNDSFNKDIAKTAYEVNTSKALKKRKVEYYK